jgi:hypothetical protein
MQGLELLVVDLMRASDLPACDDVIHHVVYQLTRELRESGISSPGISFQQFLQYVVANRDVFAQLYQKASLNLWFRRMAPPANEPQPGAQGAAEAFNWSPTLCVSVWVSGMHQGRRLQVWEAVDVCETSYDESWKV